MQRAKYAPEFKDEAVKQVIDKGHSNDTTYKPSHVQQKSSIYPRPRR